MHCLGCGADLSNPKDRRALTNPEAADIVDLWRMFLESEDLREDVDVDQILGGQDRQRLPKICKKCFAAYQTCCKYHRNIQSNLKIAMETLEMASTTQLSSQLPPAKRPRHMTQSSHTSQQSGSHSEATQSPDVAVHVGYRRPRTYLLTPRRKHMGKAIARKSHKTIAKEALKDATTKKCIMNILGKELAREIKAMASDRVTSILQSQNPDHLKQFRWDMLLDELSRYAPQLKSLLLSATKSRVPRSNTAAVVGMCAAMLINHRNPNMNLPQKIVSLILYTGHTSVQVYQRLARLNITVSHRSVIRLLDSVGKNFDSQVKEWRDSILPTLNSSNVIPKQSTLSIASHWDDHHECSSESSGSDSDSDSSWMSMSPITSDDENDCSDSSFSSGDGSVSNSEDSGDEQEEQSGTQSPAIISPSQPPDATTSDRNSSPTDLQHASGQESGLTEDMESQQGPSPTLYHICGDNIDKGMKQRYMRAGVNKPDSVHYFHSYAVADRVDFRSLSDKVIPTLQHDKKQLAMSLLPAPEDDEALRDNIVIQMSRILFENMEFFRLSFDGLIQWHIKHQFYKEMSTRSIVNPLGIQPRSENKTEEMVEIMSESQKYVPMVETIKDVHIPSIDQSVQVVHATGYPILFAGDQLTAERARGAKKAKVNAVSPSEQLAGLIPVAADWHTKVKLLEVMWKYFYSCHSAGDHGTLYQIRNKLHLTNVPQIPKKDFDACEEFIVIVTSGLVVAATQAALQLKSPNDHPTNQTVPGADLMWTRSNSERQECLKGLCRQVYDTFINFKFSATATSKAGPDNVFNYSVQLLRLGCFYMEFRDAIKEGDGDRVLRCWRYMIPMFAASGNYKYACEAANLVLQHSYTLSPRLSAQLLWSRFVNTQGRPGRNIPVDLHMEHMNKLAKGAIRFTGGANMSERAISRVGKAIGTLSPVLDNFDEVNNVATSTSSQKRPRAHKDIEIVANELVKAECFVVHTKARKHSRFPNPKNLLTAKDRKELMDWLIGKLA